MTFSASIEVRDEGDVIHLVGSMDEHSEPVLTGLSTRLGPCTIFNFRKVSNLTSSGVRVWTRFLKHIQPPRKAIFEECPSEIVAQINMIPLFRGRAEIRSVYANFACDDCHTHTEVLFKAGVNMPASPDAPLPTVTCSQCKKAMEMEELETEFFAWLVA